MEETKKDVRGVPEGDVVLSRRRFEHCGVDLEEILLLSKKAEGWKVILFWCRYPFEQAEVEGRLNPMYNVSWSDGSGDQALIDAGRARIMELFREKEGLPKSEDPYRDSHGPTLPDYWALDWPEIRVPGPDGIRMMPGTYGVNSWRKASLGDWQGDAATGYNMAARMVRFIVEHLTVDEEGHRLIKGFYVEIPEASRRSFVKMVEQANDSVRGR